MTDTPAAPTNSGTTSSDERHHAGFDRRRGVRRARGLAWLTLGWNLVEGVVALVAAFASGSVALLGFGIDSFVESSSSIVILWRFGHERDGDLPQARLDALEHRAHRWIGASLVALALFVVWDAGHALWTADAPAFSAVGTGLTAFSAVVMWWLAREKRELAEKLDSGALGADATQSAACWWLSLAALCGLGLNGLFGWWWADPVAALAVAGLIAYEGRLAWRGQTCC